MTEPNASEPERAWYVKTYADKPTVTVDAKWLTNRQGRDFVLFAGLLDAAHRAGLQEIRTLVVQTPHPQNQMTTIVHATAAFPWGSFDGVGDANPENTNRMIAPHAIRMAETRAKARALRDALNVAAVAIEELAETPRDDNEAERHREAARVRTQPSNEPDFVGDPPSARRVSEESIRRAASAAAPPKGPRDQAVEKFDRMRTTAVRMATAGTLDLDDALIAPFPADATVEDVERRMGQLLVLINAALQKKKEGGV